MLNSLGLQLRRVAPDGRCLMSSVLFSCGAVDDNAVRGDASFSATVEDFQALVTVTRGTARSHTHTHTQKLRHLFPGIAESNRELWSEATAVEFSDADKTYPGDARLKACAIAKQRPIAVIAEGGDFVSLYSVKHTLDECGSTMGSLSAWFCRGISLDDLRELLSDKQTQTPLIVLVCSSMHFDATETTDLPPR